jgi:hypothetical protein
VLRLGARIDGYFLVLMLEEQVVDGILQLEGPKGICEMLNELAQPFAEKHKDRKSTSLGDQFDNCLILVEVGTGRLKTMYLSLASVGFLTTEVQRGVTGETRRLELTLDWVKVICFPRR